MLDENYANLVAKVDDTFASLRQAAGDLVSCKLGCHQCCRPGLTVSKIEQSAIKDYVEGNPKLHKKLAALAQADPHQSQRCSFLDSNGSCAIYAVRPLICRSHGVAIRYQDQGIQKRSACELNYGGINLDELPLDSLLNIDLLNTMLALIGEHRFGESAKNRYNLSLSGITAPQEQ